MKEIIREASVHWRSDRNGQTAQVSTGGGLFKPADFLLDVVRDPRADGAAAELIAAAHAMSFCLALSHDLGTKALQQGDILVTAVATMRRALDGWTIANIALTVLARLPGVSQEWFIDAAIGAKTKCIVSRSLRASVSMNAKLEEPPMHHRRFAAAP